MDGRTEGWMEDGITNVNTTSILKNNTCVSVIATDNSF
jgi:hypothetical protein